MLQVEAAEGLVTPKLLISLMGPDRVGWPLRRVPEADVRYAPGRGSASVRRCRCRECRGRPRDRDDAGGRPRFAPLLPLVELRPYAVDRLEGWLALMCWHGRCPACGAGHYR